MDKRLTRQLYIIRALDIATFGYCFAIPVMVLYITDLFGQAEYYFYLAVVQSFVVFSCGTLFGKVADKCGRKPALVAGLGFSIISWFLLFYAPTLPLVVTAFLLRGVGEAFLGTSHSAYLFDLLQAHKANKRYNEEEAKKSSYGIIVITLLTLFAGFSYQVNPGLPFVLNFFFSFIMLLFVIFGLPNIKPHQKTASIPQPDKEKISEKIFTLKKPLVWLVFSQGVWFGIMNYIIFAYQAHFQDLGAGSIVIGIAISAVYIFRAAGAWLVGFKWHERHIGIAALAAIVLIVLSALTSSILLVIGLLLLFSFAREFISTATIALLTIKSPAQYRSMVHGTANMYSAVTSMGLNALSGVILAIWYGQGLLLMQAGMLLVIFGGCWLMYRMRSKHTNAVHFKNQLTLDNPPDQ